MKLCLPIVLALIVASLTAMLAQAEPTSSPGVLAHSEQGAEKMAILYSGTAETRDGLVLKDGDWFGPDQSFLLQPGAIVITAEMQVIVATAQQGFHTSISPLSMYCPGCACGCGQTVAYWQSPSGEMDNAWCDDHKDEPCVDNSDGTPSWHLLGTCLSSWVPCK